MKLLENFINNEWYAPCSGEYLAGINPATEQQIYQVANGGSRDIELAVEACQQALPGWRQLTIEQRTQYLFRLAELIEANIEELAQLESQDTGKPLSLAKMVDIPRSAKNFKFFAQAMSQFSSDFYQDGQHLHYVHHQPVGIIGCISPWNLPLYLLTWKIAPALAAGNCVIAKPSELTPLTAHYLCDLVLQAGLPKGVLNIVHGEGQTVGSALCTHPDVHAISFTGGTETGKTIAKSVAADFKKLSLEMGGKNAAVVFKDCDLDKAIETTVRSAYANQGEICLCTSRIFVEQDIYDEFKSKLLDKIAALVKGLPSDPNTQFGALVSKAHQAKVFHWVKQAQSEGAEILTGGNPYQINERGFYFEPTLLEGASNVCSINQQEIFGPVACLLPFTSEQQVLEQINDSQYGLATTIWTSDLKKAHQMAAEVETGLVWINTWMQRDLRTPFGGMKNSGLGREGGFHALAFCMESKNICIEL